VLVGEARLTVGGSDLSSDSGALKCLHLKSSSLKRQRVTCQTSAGDVCVCTSCQ